MTILYDSPKTSAVLKALLVGFLAGVMLTMYMVHRYGPQIAYFWSGDLTPAPPVVRIRPPETPVPVIVPEPNRAVQSVPQTQDLAPLMAESQPQAPPEEMAKVQEPPQINEAKEKQPEPKASAKSSSEVSKGPGEVKRPMGTTKPVDGQQAGVVEGVPARSNTLRPMVPETPKAINDSIAELRQKKLLLPLRDLKKEDLRDSFNASRGNHVHEAIDILAPRNTPILAVEDGTIAKLWYSVPGGITIYQLDPQKKYEYYYAHLERYEEGLKDGMSVKRGQVIGYVGTSGNAPKNTPHLHFTIFKLSAEKHWWQGTPINPYQVFRY